MAILLPLANYKNKLDMSYQIEMATLDQLVDKNHN